MSRRALASALIVGAGLMGRWHAQALRRVGVAVAGVVDTNLDRASRLAARAGGAGAYDSLDDALRRTEATVAHVCTPVESHTGIIERSFAAGLHVIAEKPLTSRASETIRLMRMAGTGGLRVCPVHQFLFQSGFLRCQEAMVSSGRILHIDSVAVSAGAVGRDPSGTEEVVADILPHPLSIMRRLVGPPFASSEWLLPRAPKGELRAAGTCGGTSLAILVSMGGRPTRNAVTIVCERATFHVDLFHGFAVKEAAPPGRASKVLRPFSLAVRSAAAASLNLGVRVVRREPAYPGLRELVRRFYASLSGPEPEPIPPSETTDVALVRERLMEARVH